ALQGFTEASNRNFTVMLDTTLTESLLKEGTVRDFIRSIQDFRKKKNLSVEQRIHLYVSASEEFIQIINHFDDLVNKGILLH
uniref:DUF5915 domain-containing protein n=1 Tax=Serratia marcescens TaxID=615 RepID=UPI001967C887